MISEITLGLVSCFILTLCCLSKKNKRKNKIIKVNTISVYPNPHFNSQFNPPTYNENISNPIFMNNNQIVYEQNPPPEYTEN